MNILKNRRRRIMENAELLAKEGKFDELDFFNKYYR